MLEVGCGTGQATRSLAALGYSVTAIEPGAGMAALARQRLGAFGNVEVENSTFEEWDDGGRRFDVLVAASAWHWVDPSIGWRRAHDVLRPGGWMALLGNVVVRRPAEPEVYAETADLHERFSAGNPGWGHPPLEDEVRMTDEGWGMVTDPGGLFGPTIVRWYPAVQWFDADGFAGGSGPGRPGRAGHVHRRRGRGACLERDPPGRGEPGHPRVPERPATPGCPDGWAGSGLPAWSGSKGRAVTARAWPVMLPRPASGSWRRTVLTARTAAGRASPIRWMRSARPGRPSRAGPAARRRGGTARWRRSGR